MKTRVPDVHVVPLPDDAAAYCETLDRLWLFDGAQADRGGRDSHREGPGGAAPA